MSEIVRRTIGFFVIKFYYLNFFAFKANRTFQQKKSSGNDTAVVECIHNEIPSRCTPYYLACVNGHRVRRHCPFGLFINPATERCERRAQIAICTIQQLQNSTLSPSTITIQRRPSPIIPTYAQFYPEKFCSELPDGLYRHPKNCSRILQVFFYVEDLK